jgi:hypothetical protein
VDEPCELCEAAPITERFYDDELCWIAECESCNVPMVVWKAHDPDPPEEVRVVLVSRLAEVMALHFESEWWLDDKLRSVPHHYHAHARTRGDFFRHPLRRDATQ